MFEYGAKGGRIFSMEANVPGLGVNTAIVRDNRILLTLRPDWEVWCLPGGSVEADESLAQAAIRETREEVGLEVKLTRLVGLYSRNGWIQHGLHVAVFAAEITGGELAYQDGEVLEARWFAADEVPEDMLLGHRQRALDALAGVSGAVWNFDSDWPFEPELTRGELYARCEQSGLSKAEYYRRFVGRPGAGGSRREV
jgi:ADP-ribose pyrophosphatase YjhB (NUDIX family)